MVLFLSLLLFVINIDAGLSCLEKIMEYKKRSMFSEYETLLVISYMSSHLCSALMVSLARKSVIMYKLTFSIIETAFSNMFRFHVSWKCKKRWPL